MLAAATLAAGCGSSGSGTTTDAGKTTVPSAQDLPDGTVATVAEVPAGAGAPFDAPYEDCGGKEVTPDVGEITEAEFKCAFVQAAAAAELKKAPQPGDPKYEEVKEAAMKSLIEAAWIQAVAAEKGVSATRPEVDRELRKVKEGNFKTESEYRDFLKSSRYSAQDVNERIELQILSHKLELLAREAAKSSSKVAEEEAVSHFLSDFHRKWRARTVCAPEFAIFLCSNVEAP